MIAGRYSLDRKIGHGGMGVVWLGTDTVLDRPVALKRIGLLPGADRTDVARAEREAQLAARLSHPHIVSVLNLVADEDTGDRWLVMEYVEGTTLARLVRERGSLSPDEAAPLLRQTADALAAAHAAGIVHRDVKPANILIDRDNRAKLTDFGIARAAGDVTLTRTGLVTGSPGYLGPEVAAGGRGDEKVDVWSFGATAFHALSGRPPYDVEGNVLGTLYRIVNDEPPRLAEAGWLAPMLEGTMAKDPSRRWTMAQVRDFLSDPAGHPAPPAPPGHPGRPEAATRPLRAADRPLRTRAPRRGVLLAMLAALLALVVVAGVVAGVVALGRDRPPAPAAASGAPSRSPSAAPSRGPSPSPTHTAPAGPTRRGMESFIRDYVAAVGSDPHAAWAMLSPKFQRESGGFDTYRRFWSGVGTGHILALSANPRTMVVRYRVRFDHFGTGRRPTVLSLVYRHGRYLIDAEHTRGFEPAG